MKLSLIINGALVLLLAMTNQGRLAALSEWIYSSLCSSFTIPALYGLVLIYLLVSVYHLENTTENSSTGRRRNRLVPYYNSEGQLRGWVREEKSQNTRPATSLQQPIRNSQLPGISTAPSASAPAKQTTPLPLPQPTASATPRLSEATPFSALASWDGFPDGRIKCHFTPQQVADTSQLVIYWAADKLGIRTDTGKCDVTSDHHHTFRVGFNRPSPPHQQFDKNLAACSAFSACLMGSASSSLKNSAY
ncbi:hypothetical protein R3P38DRAFT_3226956 [Favolaschia claudopus]|uniref:Uncharacterized protein n=1 Tax=Favolaschia claudopus TaxID=2862362 RepID=A0AAV9ZSU3_9AGAR